MTFIGHYVRTLDAKNRLQIPSQFRQAVEAGDQGGWYITLGQRRHTLSLVTAGQFETMCERMRTESIPGQDSLDFEQRFYSTTAHVEMDKQGRMVLPEYLTSMAHLDGEVVLAGAKTRVDLWRKQDFEKLLGIDWEHDWPDWQRFLRGPIASPPDAKA
ncbi:MAG: division/cell wall cluster transcriptional repressor MraZ [Phycisphaerae bacterium]